jgi:predicted ATP-grasp superfamily ATP-dependent carboligase
LAVCHLTRLLPHNPKYTAVLPSPELADTFVQKPRFYRSLAACQIPHPRTFDPTEQTLTKLLQHVSFPVFLKPASSQLFYRHFRCKGFVASTPARVHEYLEHARAAGFHLLLQEIVPGPPHHLIVVKGYINQTGQLQILFASQNLRQPTPFLDNSCSVSIRLSRVRNVADQTVQYLTRVQYRGLFIAEWKRDARDQTMKLLEINPRCGGYNAHPVACGVNPLLAAYHDALKHPIQVIRSYLTPVYCIHLLTDIPSCLRALWRRQTTLHEILQTYRGTKHWLVYARDDVLPFLHQHSSSSLGADSGHRAHPYGVK